MIPPLHEFGETNMKNMRRSVYAALYVGDVGGAEAIGGEEGATLFAVLYSRSYERWTLSAGGMLCCNLNTGGDGR